MGAWSVRRLIRAAGWLALAVALPVVADPRPYRRALSNPLHIILLHLRPPPLASSGRREWLGWCVRRARLGALSARAVRARCSPREAT